MVHHLQEQWENVRGHSGKTCATISINETKFESKVSIDEVPEAWVARGEAHGVDAFGMSPVQEFGDPIPRIRTFRTSDLNMWCRLSIPPIAVFGQISAALIMVDEWVAAFSDEPWSARLSTLYGLPGESCSRL
jgi:hypothetical protein